VDAATAAEALDLNKNGARFDLVIIPVAYRSRKGKSNLKRWDQFYTIGMFDQIEVWYGALNNRRDRTRSP
jgi:hypothetical protein